MNHGNALYVTFLGSRYNTSFAELIDNLRGETAARHQRFLRSRKSAKASPLQTPESWLRETQAT
jgi:hypothetical protein